MGRRLNYILIPLILSAFTAPASSGLPAGPDMTLVYREGSVTLKGDEIPVRPVLKRLCDAAGMEIFIFDELSSETVTADLKDETPERALRTLLRGVNYAVIYHPVPGPGGVRFMLPQSMSTDTSGTGPTPRGRSSLYRQGAEEADASSLGLLERHAVSPVGRHTVPTPTSRRVNTRSSNGEPIRDFSSTEQTILSQGANAATPSDKAAFQTSPRVDTSAHPTREERLKKIIARYEQRIADGTSDRQYEVNRRLLGEEHVVHDRERVKFFQRSLEKITGE